MTPVELSRTVLRAVRRAVDDGELSVAVPARAVVERPRPGGCGDYATNVALQLAGPAGRPPRAVAEVVRAALVREPAVAEVTVTGPGFLNITLDPAHGDTEALRSAVVREIRVRGGRYGYGDALAGERAELRVPRELRAELVAEASARIAATQGATATVSHTAPYNLRPVPAPADIHTALAPRTTTGARTDEALYAEESSYAEELSALPAAPLTDAIRWTLLHPALHDRPRPLHEHLVLRETNPLFRVQYAHTRTRALTHNAAALGLTSTPADPTAPDPTMPRAASTPELHPLVEALAAHPQALASAARHRAPDRLARHLVVLADALLAYRHTVLPLGDEKPSAAHRDRLALAEAAGTVLAGGLSLLGISSPEHL
ncbi:hypothetical protein DY218_28935 [Streptomyces triticagri]|uniref:arginine--tRNA ligase n=1 Tax=Streptomyces triticagri TaxID=2293568 RepID=A0A372LX30_9ACTN|nr:DALR anticodon-binding domain-containing protein [Streptomyces triticagri]RFU83222.1 hypothetical protein DY218_28935 [Streptomyces triticagri]